MIVNVCPICHNHANKLYDLRAHSLSSSVQGPSTSACETCTQKLYHVLRREKERRGEEVDEWISEMMGDYD